MPALRSTFVFALALATSSCSRTDPPSPETVRLIDLAGEATVTGAVDLERFTAAARRSATDRVTARADVAHRIDGEDVRVVALAAPPDGAPTWVAASVEDARLFVPDRPLDAAALRDAAVIGELAAGFGVALPALTTLGPHGGVVVARGAAPVEVERLTLSGPFRWLADSERTAGSAYARRVAEEDERCEVLVLPGGSSMTFEVDVPARSPRLTFDVAARYLPAKLDGALVIEVGAGAEAVSTERPLGRGSWAFAPAEVDLAAYAGARVPLRLEARASAPRGFVLLRAPRITSERAARPPDVVLISLDTARADRMSLYGGPRPTTPHLDRLAETSVVFERAMTSAPWTLPAHATMLSGQYPDRHGAFQTNGAVPTGLPWLPADFRRVGYVTRAFTGGGYVGPSFGFAKGFERYGFLDPATPPAAWAERRSTFKGTDMRHRAANAAAQREKIARLLTAPRGEPLFLFLHTYQAHEYRADPAVLARFGMPADEVDVHLDGVYGEGTNPFLAKEMDEAERARRRVQVERIYDAAMVDADAFVGEVVAALEEAGRLDETILIVTSDHGEALLDREAYVGHGKNLYEEQIRVPLLVRGPGFPARRVPDVVSTVDLAPTLRELCGLFDPHIDTSPMEDGRSLVPLLAGGALERRAVLARGGEKNATDAAFRARRGSRFKLMVDERPSRVRLFDLREDPGERADLAAARAEEAARMAAQLERGVEALEARRLTGARVDMPPELIAELEALGYLGDD